MWSPPGTTFIAIPGTVSSSRECKTLHYNRVVSPKSLWAQEATTHSLGEQAVHSHPVCVHLLLILQRPEDSQENLITHFYVGHSSHLIPPGIVETPLGAPLLAAAIGSLNWYYLCLLTECWNYGTEREFEEGDSSLNLPEGIWRSWRLNTLLIGNTMRKGDCVHCTSWAFAKKIIIAHSVTSPSSRLG